MQLEDPISEQTRSFFKAPLCTDLDRLEADVAFIGVPFGQGTLGRPRENPTRSPSETVA